jgi:hypothetical protein
MESWIVTVGIAAASAVITALATSFWAGRNVITKEDFDKLRQAMQDDRHTARSNMDQRSMIFQEKVEELKDKVHGAELRLTRIEAKQNGGPHK